MLEMMLKLIFQMETQLQQDGFSLKFQYQVNFTEVTSIAPTSNQLME